MMNPKGYYIQPRHLHFYLREKLINKNEFLLLTLLLNMANFYKAKTGKSGFTTTDEKILEWGLIAEKPLALAKKSLQEKLFISVKQGRYGVGSEYQLLERLIPEK